VDSALTIKGWVGGGIAARRSTPGGIHVVLAMGGVRDARHGQQRPGDRVRRNRARRAGRVASLLWGVAGGVHRRPFLEPVLASNGDTSVLQPCASTKPRLIRDPRRITGEQDDTSAYNLRIVGYYSRSMQLAIRRQVRMEWRRVVLRDMLRSSRDGASSRERDKEKRAREGGEGGEGGEGERGRRVAVEMAQVGDCSRVRVGFWIFRVGSTELAVRESVLRNPRCSKSRKGRGLRIKRGRTMIGAMIGVMIGVYKH
jgi:hypothetical protein